MSTRASRASVALSLASVLLLAACSSGGDAVAESAPTPTTTVVEDMTGEVEIPTDPQAALGMYTTDVDILLTLGFPLAASQPVRDEGYQTFPSFFPQEELEGVETFTNFPEYNFEAILAAQPDFILNGLGYDADVVERLPQIAPTYSFNGFDGSDWRDIFRATAAQLGREEQAQAWFDAYEARVAEVKAELDARDVHPVVGPVDYWDGQVSVSCYGVPCLVLRDLGVEITPLATAEGTSLSPEQLSQLAGIDVFLTSAAPAGDGTFPDVFEPVAANPLWQALPAVQDGQIHTGDMEMLYGSPSGHMAYLEFVAGALLGDDA
ncbi:ABC transporter substrate-binding protein [Cellulomonas sp. ES6]|uniref:ABC transporter substrate-binding protein n=1 Tax=Cellulomonas sp. ES6 TaxID=3039384 RepID=UPI0019AFD0E5|nr:ABC transporter substrate-binding protein [Cellulomonas sp. ES6]MBD3780091.1 ABC transporter substrate-binding protein [Micrococcales bacterium]WHP17274.1 ABC transporter substrate-binding protein [Cellulomonas sp. ES6]